MGREEMGRKRRGREREGKDDPIGGRDSRNGEKRRKRGINPIPTLGRKGGWMSGQRERKEDEADDKEVKVGDAIFIDPIIGHNESRSVGRKCIFWVNNPFERKIRID